MWHVACTQLDQAGQNTHVGHAALELGAFLEDSIEGELFTNTAPFGPQGRLIS